MISARVVSDEDGSLQVLVEDRIFDGGREVSKKEFTMVVVRGELTVGKETHRTWNFDRGLAPKVAWKVIGAIMGRGKD
ncbi:MAG: hypothetical protein HWN68_09665 [Desulfobacterales bacterium]|nr:hypothetical protein [Desulfobacterales bacterium]